jgi:hypothetical protein
MFDCWSERKIIPKNMIILGAGNEKNENWNGFLKLFLFQTLNCKMFCSCCWLRQRLESYCLWHGWIWFFLLSTSKNPQSDGSFELLLLQMKVINHNLRYHSPWKLPTKAMKNKIRFFFFFSCWDYFIYTKLQEHGDRNNGATFSAEIFLKDFHSTLRS